MMRTITNKPQPSPVDWKSLDWQKLVDRLTAFSRHLFKSEGCLEPDSVLPGTGMSAVDLVYDVVLEVFKKRDHLLIDAPDGDPFSYLATILRCDFIDLVRAGREYRRTTIIEADQTSGEIFDDKRTRNLEEEFTQAEAAVLLRKLHLLLGDDEELKEYATVIVLQGLQKRGHIAEALNITPAEATVRKRRLAYKLKPWARRLASTASRADRQSRSRRGMKNYG